MANATMPPGQCHPVAPLWQNRQACSAYPSRFICTVRPSGFTLHQFTAMPAVAVDLLMLSAVITWPSGHGAILNVYVYDAAGERFPAKS